MVTPGGGGGAFNWTTNLPQVAQQIQRELARIESATRRAGGGTGNQAEFATGLNRQLQGVADRFDERIRTAGRGFAEQANREMEKGQRLSGRDAQGRTLQQALQPEVNRTINELNRAGTQVATAIPQGLEGAQKTILRSLGNVGSTVVSSYRGAVEGLAADLNKARLETGALFQPGRTFRVSDRPGGQELDRRAAQISSQERQLSPQELDNAKKAVRALSDQGRQTIQTDTQRARQASDQGRQLAQAWAKEFRANPQTDRLGFDPQGARRVTGPGFGEVFYDAQNRPLVRNIVEGPDGSQRQQGLRRFRPEQELQVQDQELLNRANLQLQDRALRERTREENRLYRNSTERTLAERENIERSNFERLNRQLQAGTALRTGRGAGSLIRDDAGDAFRLDPKNRRARLLTGLEAEGAQVKLDEEIARRSESTRKQRERAANERITSEERQIRTDLNQAQAQGRLERAGRFVRREGSAEVFAAPSGTDRARRVTDPIELARAEEQLSNARQRAVDRQRRAASQPLPPAVAGGGGGGRGPLDGFLAAAAGDGPGGGRGLRGGDILQNVFNYSRYFIASAAILTVVRALAAAKASAIDYRESMTDLEVALGDGTRAQAGFIAGLSDIARFAGANTGAAIDSAVRGIRAFAPPPETAGGGGGLMDRFFRIESSDTAFQQQAQRVGTEVARVAQQVAVIAEKELKDATGDVISISSAFELEGGDDAVESFSRIVDAIAIAKRQLAGDSKEIAQGLSSVGAVAAEAGFSLEETANLVSLVQARTDQTGRAVAQRLSRIFSIIGGSQGRNAIERLNQQISQDLQVDTTGSVRDQLLQISRIYGDLTSQQQGLVRNALGGAANTRELVPILQNPDLLEEALDAQFFDVGAGAEEFRRKATDLAGSLRRLTGDIQGVTTAIFEGGVGDAFLLATQGTITLTNVVRQLANVYNRLFDVLNNVNIAGNGLGNWLQTGIVLMASSIGMMRLWGRAASVGLVPQALRLGAGNRRVPGALGLTNEVLRQPVAFGGAAAMAAGASTGSVFREAGGARGIAVTGVNAVGRSIRELGRSARGFINANPLLVIAGGILAIFTAFDRAQSHLQTLDDSLDALNTSTPRSAAEMRDFAQDLRQQADTVRRSSRIIDAVFLGGQGQSTADVLDSRALRVFEFSKELEDAQREFALSRRNPIDSIRTDTSESVQESVQLLEDQGRSAETQMYALAGAIRNLADQAAQSFRQLNDLELVEFSFNVADEVTSQLQDEITNQIGIIQFGSGFFSTLFRPGERGLRDMREELEGQTGDDIQNAIREAVTAAGGQLDEGQEFDLATAIGNIVDRQLDFDDLPEGTARSLRSRVELAALEVAREWGELLDDPNAPIELASALIDRAQAGTQEQAARARLEGRGTPSVDSAQERVRLLQRARADFRRINAGREGDAQFIQGLEQLDVAIVEAELDAIEARSARIEALGRLQASEIAPSREVDRQQIELDTLRRQLRVTTDPEERDRIQTDLNEGEFQLAQLQLARTNAERESQIDSRDTVGRAYEAAAAAQRELALLIEQGDTSSADYFAARQAVGESLIAARDEELAQIRALSLASLDPRDTVGRLQVEVRAAARTLAEQIPGTRGYGEALDAFRSQAQQLTDAFVSIRQAQRLAAVDPRDRRGELNAELQNTLDDLRNVGPNQERRAQLQRQLRQQQIALIDYDRELANERLLGSIDPESGLEEARANLTIAERNLQAARFDELEYARAQRELNNARLALTQAQIEASSLQRQLNIDLTDPVATALEDVRVAQEQLAAARARGAAPDVIAEREIDLRNAEAQAEAAAFSQRLRDINVARDLGRISHAAYMAYLTEEAARLRAIGDRTRQQQEQLDQVEQALKAAREQMEAQFNIGDIRIPTPFEVRRAIAARDAGIDPGAAAGGFSRQVSPNMSTSINNIVTVSGADTAEVRRVLTELLGPSAINQVTPSTSGARRI